MEDNPIIKAFAGQLLDACDMVGCELGFELDHNASVLQLNDKRISDPP
jgi:hypothetical protein